MSDVDREVSNLYHGIERTDFDESSAYSAMKMLQHALHRRRIVKDEIARLNPIRTMLANNVKDTDRRHRRMAAMSDEIRRSISAELTIEEIGGFTL